jgi:hypothetical protein
MNFNFCNAQNKSVYEGVVSVTFLHVLTDFKIASTRHNNGIPLPIYFDNLDVFYKLTSSQPQPADFGGAKSTILGDPKTREISVTIFTHFGEGQEALITHEIGHMYLLALGYPAVFAPQGVTKLATGITNIGSHWPLNHYLRSCGIDVDTDNERRVRNISTYLEHIDFASEDPVRLSLDFVDMLTYVSESSRKEFEKHIKRKSSHIINVMSDIRSVVESIPIWKRPYPSGSEELMLKLCNTYPIAKNYKIRRDFFLSLFPK